MASVPYTLTIVAIILSYTWIVLPQVEVRGAWRVVPVVGVLAICVAHNMKTGDWGFSRRAFLPALGWSVALTIPIAGALWVIGHGLAPAPQRDAPLLDFLYVVIWGGGQQLVLQTVVLHEARRVSPRAAVLLAATIFAALHLPNPFLAIVTFTGALAWCWIYARYPNIIPLALSHAVATTVILLSFNPTITGGLRTGWRYFSHS